MKLEIITHCYRYSRVLTYQLSSLVINPPPFEVMVTVVCNWNDKPTIKVLEYFKHYFETIKKGLKAPFFMLLANQLKCQSSPPDCLHLYRNIGRQHLLVNQVL